VALDRLTVVAVDNDSATYGWRGGLERRFEVESWATRRVDGRDHAQLAVALTQTEPDRPTLVVAEVESKS
jgi:transketolase